MAIGDPWDSSYDPRENFMGGLSEYDWMLKQHSISGMRNSWTGRIQWGPDHSYLVPQDDPSTIHDRRGGRFCTEGCGCIKTDSYHPFKPNAATILPQELVVEVYKAEADETRKDILKKYHAKPYSAKQRINLAYADGAWRGRKRCSNSILRDSLQSPTDFHPDYPTFIDDPCKEQGTDCHFANNKFKNQNSDDPNDYLNSEDFNEFEGSIDDDGVWSFRRITSPSRQHYTGNDSATPRYLEDYYIKLRTDDQYFLDLDAAAAAKGQAASFKGSIAYTDKNGNIGAFQHTYNDGQYCTKYEFGNQQDCEAAGGEWLDTPERNIFVNKAKDGAPRLILAEDGYIGLKDKNGPLNDGSRSDKEIEHLPKYGSKGEIESIACIKDGFTPLKKRPYCRNPITGHRIEQECEELNLPSDSHKSKAGCTKYGTCTTVNGHVLEAGCTNAGGEWTPYKWLYADEQSCISAGICEMPEDVINTNKKRSDNIIEPRCENANGSPRLLMKNKKECEANGFIWVFADAATCEARHNTRDAYCSDSTYTTKADCEAAKETWNANRFISNDFVDHEYDNRSCCGQHVVDQNHPFRTPQFAGAKTSADGVFVKDSNLENATCFTPYEEYVLLPPEIPAVNLNDRDPLFQQEIQGQNSFWTLLIRPCRFWDSCFDQGLFLGDNKDGGNCRDSNNDIKSEYRNRKDCNYYGYNWSPHADNPFTTGCGEEIVLKIPTNQLLNDSNFNLTLTDYHSPKGDDIIFSQSTKRNMFIEAQNTNLRETQPSWDLKFGIFDRVYDWWNVTGPPPNTVLNPPSTLNGPFPADAMYEVIYDWWCNTPDSNNDGIADGASSHLRDDQRFFCNNFVYSDSPDYRQSLNPKGAETFAKFNLQPQPFKATEERQLRAKTIEQAKIDYSFWFNCVSRSWAGDAGHWFVNYGQDYFLYFDFEENKGDDTYEAHCDKISSDLNEWVKTHIGHLSNGKCSDMGAIGWLDILSGAINKDHPCGFEYFVRDSTGVLTEAYGCGGYGESSCNAAGYCQYPDGTFDNTTDQAGCTGNWVDCCEYIKTCVGPDGAEDARIVIGVDPATTEFVYGKIADNKQECEAPLEGWSQDPPNPGAGGTWNEGCQNKFTGGPTCADLGDIPEELADIVFGEQHGSCDVNGTITSESKTSCEAKNGTFTRDSVGHYAKRIGPYIKPAKNIGRLPKGYEDPDVIGSITDGIQDSSIITNAINAEIGNSPQYWHETGLYPIHETQVSFISDSCVGTKGSGRVQFASNENPIKITSPNHNLQDGDKIDIRGVLGNFAANVMTNKEWAKTQWEEKIANLNFKGTEEIINPFASCPHEPDGTCDHSKYYACDGKVIGGTDPPPAPFFIAKNVTVDTFDLYTCDKRPIDGTIENCSENKAPAPMEWYSVYGHMENITLKANDTIQSGAALGTVSDVLTNPGWNHLHFHIGEPTEDDQPLQYFAKGVVNGISFDTGYSGRSCFNQYPNEPRAKTDTKLLSDEQIDTIRDLLDLDKLLEAPDAGDAWIDNRYSVAHTHETFFAVDFTTHDANNCTAASLFGQSLRGKGKKVHNPFPDVDTNGDQIITEVVAAIPSVGLVVLKHNIIESGAASEGSVQVWASCPFTGKWETWLEPTIETMPGQTVSSSNIEYRPGWSGNAKKWEYRANDFYVAIEQKGVCPVCNDHYIPEKLNATLSTVSSEYLNVANCQINPCYEPNVCIDNTSAHSKGLDDFDILYGVRDFLCIEVSSGEAVDKEQVDCVAPDYEWKKDAVAAKEKCLQDDNIWVGEDWWNYSTSEGYCCRDEYHPCDGSDGMNIEEEIADCKENPQNYGRCQKNHVTDPAYTPQQCKDAGGSFTDPLSSPDQCEKFLRRRINVNGTTNCRRCSDVFTNENGVPLKDFVDQRSGYYSSSSGSWIEHIHLFEGTPVDKNGDSCCGKKSTSQAPPEGNCDCIGNPEKFPNCTEFEQEHGACDSSKLGPVNMGELEAQCVEEIDNSACQNSTATYVWSPDFSGGGSWGLIDSCGDPECSEPAMPTQASHPPSDVNDFVEIKLPCTGGKATYHWQFNPCSCFPNNISLECEGDRIHATDMWGEESCQKQSPSSTTFPPNKSGKDNSGWYHDNSAVGLGCGKLGDVRSTTNIGICYHQALSHQPIDSTCPGLSSVLDIPMEYDGQVWRSEWSVMDDVGLKQCGIHYDIDPTFGKFISPRNSQRWSFEANCKPDLYDDQGNKIKTADYLVYTNADCDGCDMPQHSYAGVSTFGGLEYRNVGLPSKQTDKDRHFIRLILGCGDSIPSIEEGIVKDGGFGPSPQTYQSDSMKLWAEITNCAFHDNEIHESLRIQRIADGIDGNPPCFENLGGCTKWEHFGKTIDQADTIPSSAREYMFAGQCVSHKTCGPKGPCAEVECCQYEGADINKLTAEGPLWNGSVACSTGGHINNICQAIGFQMGPDKRQEVLTVHDIIDVNHLTGEGTLVAKSKGGTCSYAAGATVSIGMAGPREAESSSRDDYTRNKHAANPFLRGTVLTESIQTPKFEHFDENGKSIGYYSGDRAGKFIYIRVKDITPLINKNSRKDRHLKYNDIRYGAIDENFNEEVEAIDKSGKKVDSQSAEPIVNEHVDYHTGLFSPKNIGLDDGSGSSMVANKKLKYPYGNNPYPVATQTISGTTKEQMWPRGKTMSPSNLESLRFASEDYANDIVAPGRTGKLWRDYDSGKFQSLHSIVDSSFFAKRKEVEITRINNVYDPIIGTCIDNENYKEKSDCTSNGHIWLPRFLNTYVGLPSTGSFSVGGTPTTSGQAKNDRVINEKIVISGTIAYKATCKGSSLGYCYKSDGSGKGKDIINCADGSQFNDGKPGKWIQVFTDAEADQEICEDVFGGKWVIGIRNPDTKADPENNNPLDLPNRERDFESGCPAACQLKGFYTDKACVAFQNEVPVGEKAGECYECISDTFVNANGDTEDFVQCPLTPIDGSHLALEHNLNSYLDTIYLDGPLDLNTHSQYVESFGEKIFGTSNDVFVLASEEHITVNDEAKIWSQDLNAKYSTDLDSLDKVKAQNANSSFDPSETRNFYTDLPKDECLSRTNTYYWDKIAYTSSNEITIEDTIDERLPVCIDFNRFEGAFFRTFSSDEREKQLQLQELISGSTLFSTQGYYDFLGDRFNMDSVRTITSSTVTKPAGVYSYKQLSEACELSHNCYFEKIPFECRGGDPKKDDGWCKTFTGNEDFVTTFPAAVRTTRENCDSNSIFTADISTSTNTYVANQGFLERHNEKECLEAGHEVIPMFLCYKEDRDISQAKSGDDIGSFLSFLDTGKGNLGDDKTVLTPQECEAAGGSVFYDGIFNTASRKRIDTLSSFREMREYTKFNKDSREYSSPRSKYKSRDFLLKGIDKNDVTNYRYINEFGKITYDWGLARTETAVSVSRRKWKGLIYAYEVQSNAHMNQKDKEDYSKYVVQDKDYPVDTYLNFYNGGPAYWSRHGGAFDVTISQKLPENKARDNNSNKPVDLEFWLSFPQICCNLRGPANYWACPKDCWPTANGTQGPVLDFIEREYGIQGQSLIHVNITEKLEIGYKEGGGAKK